MISAKHHKAFKSSSRNVIFGALLSTVILLFTCVELKAQDVKITYKASGAPLSEVFNELTEHYNLNYAYDADAFKSIRVTFNVRNQSAGELHNYLAKKYSLRFRMVEGTWIVNKTEVIHAEPDDIYTKKPKEKTNLVKGFVFDDLTGEPLVYCNIFFDGLRGTITNQLGYFQIETSAKEIQLIITHLGYQRLDSILAVNTNQPNNIRLSPLTILMDEVRILQKEKSILELGDFSEKVGFNPAQSSSLPRLVNDDLINMLTIIPGMNYLNGVGGGLSIRGGDPSENLVLLDGIPLLETGHLIGSVSMLNAHFVRQAFVSRGGFDASFGDRSAGLIELTGKSGPLTHPTIDLSANLLNTNLVANLPIAQKISFSGAWRRSLLNEWQNHLSKNILVDSRMQSFPDLSVDIFPGVFYDDLNLKASIFASENHIFSVGYMQGNDYQIFDYEIGEKNVTFQTDQKESFNRGYSFNWLLQSGRLNYNLSTAFSEIRQVSEHASGRQIAVNPIVEKLPKKNPKAANPNPNADKSNRNNIYTDNDSSRVNELRIDLKTDLKTGNFLNQAGIGFTGYYFDYHYYAERSQGNTPVDSLSKNARQDIGHLFLQQVIELFDKVKLRWGVRANYNFSLDQFYIQPRGGIEYLFSENMKGYYHSGVYRQFLARAPKIDVFGNIDRIWLLPDTSGTGLIVSQHHIFGLKYEKGGFLVNAELYSRNTEGRQSFYARQYRKANETRIQYVNYQGREINQGIDIFMQFRKRFFTQQISWTFSDSKEQLDGFNNNQFFPSLNSHRHQLYLNEIITFKGWNFSASWNFRTGQPIIIKNNDDTFGFDHMEDFSQIDIGLVKSFRTGRFILTGGASVLNVFNRSNIVGVDFLNISTESQNYSVQSNIISIGFTPVFFMRLQIL